MILVTGALGHIGSDLIIDLIRNFPDEEFVLVDNLRTQRFCSLFNLKKERITFLDLDVSKEDLSDIIKNCRIVIHLAAITDATNSFNLADEIKSNNLGGTVKIADLCALYKVKLIFISSTSVYGKGMEVMDEDCDIADLNPQSPYANSKIKEEAYIKDKNELNFVILRFGTIFGVSKGMRFHTAVNKFCWQVSLKKPITVWRTAMMQKRPYLDLNDAKRAIIFTIKNNLFQNEVYNVVTNNNSVKNIIKIIKKRIKNVKIEIVDTEIMNQLSYEISNVKIIKKGFKFTGNLEKQIFRTLDLLLN